MQTEIYDKNLVFPAFYCSTHYSKSNSSQNEYFWFWEQNTSFLSEEKNRNPNSNMATTVHICQLQYLYQMNFLKFQELLKYIPAYVAEPSYFQIADRAVEHHFSSMLNDRHV